MRFTALLLLSLISTQARANGFEYSLGASLRSYTAAVAVAPAIAYKYSLWGEADSPLEGSLRPELSSELSPATYKGKAELEFSPVMFVNFSIGKNLQRRFTKFDDDSCRFNNCVGSLNSTFGSARLLFKYEAIIGSLKFTKVFYDSKTDKNQNLVDPSTYTLVSPTNEVSNQIEAILGVELTKTWATGVLIQDVELEKNKGKQEGQYLVVLKKNGHTSYIAGAGRFKSELKAAKPSVLLTFMYDWK
jgi:hypothetical protein